MATTQDDKVNLEENSDLLILSDDNDNNNEIITLNDNIVNDDITTGNEELISFGEETNFETKTEETNLDLTNEDPFKIEETSEETSEEILITENNTSTELENLELGDLSLDITEEKAKVEEKTETKTEESNIGFGFNNEELSSSTEEVHSNIWSMTDILDWAISQFDEREKNVEKDINFRESNIKELNNEIKWLEKKVKLEELKVTESKNEKALIVKNRKVLEKMKNTDADTK